MDVNESEGELIPLDPPAEQDESRLPGLRFVAMLFAALVVPAVLMLFVALLSAPMTLDLFGGVLGAHAVYAYSVIAAVFAVAWLLLVNSAAYATSTGRTRPDEDVRHDRGARIVFFLLFLATACAFDASFRSEWHFGLAPGHDQPQYYAYLHSWVFDQDLNFENELKAIPGVWELMENAHPERPEYNVAPIGSPMLWLPFYLAALGIIHGLNAWTDTAWPTDGISAPYAVAAAFGSMTLALCGLLLTHATLRKYFSHRTAFFTVLLVAVGSPLMWYVIDQPLMSHAPSFFAAALLFYLWAGWRNTSSFLRYGLIGGAIGLAMLVRPSHAVLLVLPAIDWFLDTSRSARTELDRDPDAPGELPPFAQAGIRFALFVGIPVLVFTPQLLTWFFRYGFDNPPGSPMQWTSPDLIAVLYSAHNGFFAYHPIAYVGFLGVPLLWRKSRVLCGGVAITLILYTYCNGAIQSWWGGGSFGMRRFVGVLPFVAPGIAAAGSAAYALIRKRPTALIWATAAMLLAWNTVLTLGIRQGAISFYQPKTFESIWQSAATVVHEHIGNPASYPLNVWFSARHGVPLGRYDYLSGFRQEEFLGAPTKGAGADFDVADLKPVQGPDVKYFLGRGWHDTFADFRRHQGSWCAKTRHPTLLLPLRKGWTYTLELTLITPPFLGGPQKLKFYLNGKAISGIFELEEYEEAGVRVTLPETATRDGVNTLTIELASERPLPNRNESEVWPGSGLSFNTWNPHVESLFLKAFKIVPVLPE